jgi:hypothetical protein
MREHPEATELEALMAIYDSQNKELAAINKQGTKLTDQAEVRKQRALLDEKQSLGNKLATGKYQDTLKSALHILQTQDGTTTDPERIKNIIYDYYKEKLTAPHGRVKTGKYLPHETPRNYPWTNKREFRRYSRLLEGAAPAKREWLHDAIDVEVVFDTCLKTLAKGKAPGPDKMPNEILQALPEEGKRAMHNLIMIMWATGLTPDTWKNNATILLFKHKGTPMLLQYLRRIGLESTIYKLWTRMVTVAMADRAQRLHMLSSSHAGFRSKRTTAHQVEMMIMALEDAHLTRQKFHLL